MFGTERARAECAERRTKGQSPWRITLHDKRQVCIALDEDVDDDDDDDEDEEGDEEQEDDSSAQW